MSTILDFLRGLSAMFDVAIYWLAGNIYQVFCAVATSTIIESADVQAFAKRLYVVVGVFALFKIGIAMLKYLVNPDQLTDSKNGYSKIIWNVTIALILLVSIPSLYGFANDAQAAILKSNIIAKVVLGKTTGGSKDFKDAGNSIVFTTLSAFVTPNYMATDTNGNHIVLTDPNVQECFNVDTEGKPQVKYDENKNVIANYPGIFTKNENADGTTTFKYSEKCEAALNYMVGEENSDVVRRYLDAHQKSDIVKLMDIARDVKLSDTIQEQAGKNGWFDAKLYFLKYTCIISLVVGLFLCFIFLTFCIDMGIRSIKLAFLILISPIPVLSMINPDKGANGMLSKWWQMTWATYLDLFLRIFAIFFVIYIVGNVDLTARVSSEFGIGIAMLTTVFIIIGALLFAKELPGLISSLIPGMDSIMKGGFNPFKKVGEAVKTAGRAPLVGKPLTGLTNRFAAQQAMKRANNQIAKDHQNKRNDAIKAAYKQQAKDIKNSNITDAEKAKQLKAAKEAKNDAIKASREMKRAEVKAGDAAANEVGKEAGAAAAAKVSLFGGEAKHVTSTGETYAKIKKENADKTKKMKEAAKQRAGDAEIYEKAGGNLPDSDKKEAAKAEFFGEEHYGKMKTVDNTKAAMKDAQAKYDIAQAEHSRAGTVTINGVTYEEHEADAKLAELSQDLKQKTGDCDKAKAELKSYEEVNPSAGEKRAAYEREADRQKIAAQYAPSSTAATSTTTTVVTQPTSTANTQTTVAAQPTSTVNVQSTASVTSSPSRNETPVEVSREEVVRNIETKMENDIALTKAEEAIVNSRTVMEDIVNQSNTLNATSQTIAQSSNEIAEKKVEIERAQADLAKQQQQYAIDLAENEQKITKVAKTIHDLSASIEELRKQGNDTDAQLLAEEVKRLKIIYDQATGNDNK